MKRSLCSAFLALLLSACNDGTSPNNNTTTTPPTSGFNNVSGTVTLTIHASGSGKTTLGSETLTKNENISVDLSFVLPIHKLTTTGAGSNCSWDSPKYGGTSSQFEETLTEYDCMGGRATDKDTLSKTYSTGVSGDQLGGVNLVIQNDGSYGITISGTSLGNPTQVTHSIGTFCGMQTHSSTTGFGPGVPFSQYFSPFTDGAMGSLTGKVTTANPAHIAGVFNGKDNLTLFTQGTSSVLFPFDYVVSWDLTLIK
jgi:hypothetical protein